MDVKIAVLTLVALGPLTTEALPRLMHTRKCHLSHYRNLVPSQLRAAQHLRTKYVESMSPIIRSCPWNLLQQKPPMHKFTVHDRLILVEQKVAIAVHVLRNISNSKLSKFVSKPLVLLVTISEHLEHCVNAQAHGSHPSTLLDAWLQEVNKDIQKESQQCLEVTMILNLLQLLNWEVKCAAYLETCDQLMKHHHTHPVPITANHRH